MAVKSTWRIMTIFHERRGSFVTACNEPTGLVEVFGIQHTESGKALIDSLQEGDQLELTLEKLDESQTR